MDKKQVTYYRKVARFLYLKQLIKEQMLDVNDELMQDYDAGLESGTIKGESGTIKIVRPEKVSHKADPSLMIDTPPSWKAGIDFPVMFSGNRKSPLNQQAINILSDEQNKLSDEILKEYDKNLDFNILHNDLKYEDLPPKHLKPMDSDYRKVWYNGEVYSKTPQQAKFIKFVHIKYLKTDEKIFDSYDVFTAIGSNERKLSNLFRKEQGLKDNLIKTYTKNTYILDLDF